MTANLKKFEQVRFELPSALTWGVENDKYGGYSIPVVLYDETAERIEDLVQEHCTKSPLYGKTLYLKSKKLSEKQMSELYNKGKNSIEVHFVVKGVYNNTRKGISYLTSKVTKLRKTEKPESDDSCPED
jgi:isochorismate synthase EntC